MKSDKALISFPNGFMKDIDALAARQFMTRSEVIREALRDYVKKPRATSQEVTS